MFARKKSKYVKFLHNINSMLPFLSFLNKN